MNEFVQPRHCSYNVDEVPSPADDANMDDTTQKLSNMKSVIDVFATRVSESKGEAYTNILQSFSGVYAAVQAVVGGQLLLRVQVNTLLLMDIELTMKVGRSVLSRYYSLSGNQHGSASKGLENKIFRVLEYFLAPMQAITLHEAVCYETLIAGTHYKYPDHLSEIGLLRFQGTELDQDLEQGLDNLYHGANGSEQP